MKSVSIVGLGWLGLPLARHLKNLGWEVKGSKRTHEGVEQMRLIRLESYYLELTPEINADPDDLTDLLSVDALVINIPPSQYFFDLENYVVGVKNLVNEALLYGVTHLIFISSTSVFAEVSGKFDENCQPQPSSDVGKALVEIENWLFQLQDIDVDVIRLDDCARAIQLLLETPSYQRLYHLCAPEHPSRAEYYTRMAEKLGLNSPHFLCDEDDPKREIVADKICRELEFVYQYPDPYQMLSKQD